MTEFDGLSSDELSKIIQQRINDNAGVDDILKWMYENGSGPEQINRAKLAYSTLLGHGSKHFNDFILKTNPQFCVITQHNDRHKLMDRIKNKKLKSLLSDMWDVNFLAYNDTLFSMWLISNDKEIMKSMSNDESQLITFVVVLYFILAMRRQLSFDFYGDEISLRKLTIDMVRFLKPMYPEIKKQLEEALSGIPE